MAFARQDIPSLLQPRPRPPPPPAAPRRDNPKKRDTPPPNPKAKGKASAAAAASSAKVKEEVPEPNAPPKKKVKSEYPGFDSSWARSVNNKEVCVRFALGKCNAQKCRFLHACPVPDAAGKPCGQPRSALQHQAAPH